MLDKDIREPLFDYLDERYGKVRTIEEKTIGNSRADVIAVVEGELLGFEIKSDSDTYTRLKTQIRDYERFCDRCFIVVGEKHTQVESHVPDHWGIIFVNEENVIVEREAITCPKVSIYNQMDLLWRNELAAIQEKEGLPKLAGTKRRLIYERLIRTAGEPTIKHDMTEVLFERDYTIYDTSVVKKKRKVKRIRKSTSSDRTRAHVTNYVGKRKRKTKIKKG